MVQRYTNPEEESRGSRKSRERSFLSKREVEREDAGRKRTAEWKGVAGYERGWRAEDDDIDSVLDPAFASSAISRLPTPQEGGTRWPLVGLPGPGRVYVS